MIESLHLQPNGRRSWPPPAATLSEVAGGEKLKLERFGRYWVKEKPQSCAKATRTRGGTAVSSLSSCSGLKHLPFLSGISSVLNWNVRVAAWMKMRCNIFLGILRVGETPTSLRY